MNPARPLAIGSLALLFAAAPAPGQAQPAEQAPSREGSAPTPTQPPAQTDDDRREARRAWLVREIEESRREQARLSEMLAKLDAGEPLPDFRRRRGRDDDDRRGDRRDRVPHDPSSDERLRLVAEFARNHLPEFAGRLQSEHASDPEAATRIASRFWPRIAELLEIEESDPELFAVEIERLRNGGDIMSAVRSARRNPPADEAAREALTSRLRQLVARQFELRLSATRLRLESLRARVAETEQELEEREAKSASGVDEQVQRLLRMIDRRDRDHDDKRDNDTRDKDGGPG